MKRLYIIVEGKTETFFIKKVVAPYLAQKSLTVFPYCVVTSRDKNQGRIFRGGVSSYQKIKNDFINCAKISCSTDVFFSSMFDLYALPKDFPGNDTFITDAYQKVDYIELAFKKDLQLQNFIPYIQLHEFESLIFSDLYQLQSAYFEYNIDPLKDSLKKIKNPELINCGADSAPSKRIKSCIPIFDKSTLGVEIIEKISLEKLRSTCRHFNEWICKLEQI